MGRFRGRRLSLADGLIFNGIMMIGAALVYMIAGYLYPYELEGPNASESPVVLMAGVLLLLWKSVGPFVVALGLILFAIGMVLKRFAESSDG